jgi:two-component system LytT family sensor kinase
LKPQKKIFIVIAHIIAWVCFLILPHIFSNQPKEQPSNISNHLLTLLIVINTLLVGFYYLNTLVLIPKFLFKKKWVLYFSFVLIYLFAFEKFSRPIAHAINGSTEQSIRKELKEEYKQRLASSFEKDTSEVKSNDLKLKPYNTVPLKYFPRSFIVFLLICTIGICISVIQLWLETERKKDKVENEKTTTELSFLKSQVNPHFFFNTLNNIYSLAVIQSNKTADAVLKLSHIMRYILTETQTELVPLENEINFIQNFIDLQAVRLTDKVSVNFDVIGYFEDKQIAPLLFIPFIENAFKYGVSTKENTEINIQLNVEDKKITLSVSNNIVQQENFIQETTGIGIQNVKRRLAFLYPKKHELKIETIDNSFLINLQIELI